MGNLSLCLLGSREPKEGLQEKGNPSVGLGDLAWKKVPNRRGPVKKLRGQWQPWETSAPVGEKTCSNAREGLSNRRAELDGPLPPEGYTRVEGVFRGV